MWAHVSLSCFQAFFCAQVQSLTDGCVCACVEYVAKYATKENVDDAGNDTDDSDEMSSVGSLNDDEDDEPVGTMDEV